MEDLVVGHSYRKVLNCNWKIFWENFNECLHCPNVHPELCDLVPIYGRAIMARRDDPEWEARAAENDPRVAGGLRTGAETWSMDGRAQGMLPGLTEAEKVPGQRYGTVLPSCFIVAHLDYVRIVRITPLSPETMELSSDWLFHPEMLAQPNFDKARITDFATLVLDQDGAACEINQRGLKAAAFEHGVLMQEEYEVFLFQDWVREALGELRLGEPAASRASRRAE
jgi:Rieske 2Fe-2S family protein